MISRYSHTNTKVDKFICVLCFVQLILYNHYFMHALFHYELFFTLDFSLTSLSGINICNFLFHKPKIVGELHLRKMIYEQVLMLLENASVLWKRMNYKSWLFKTNYTYIYALYCLLSCILFFIYGYTRV